MPARILEENPPQIMLRTIVVQQPFCEKRVQNFQWHRVQKAKDSNQKRNGVTA